MIEILLLVCVIILLYQFAFKPHTYWAKKNVRTGQIIPIIWENFQLILGRLNFLDMVKNIYNQVSDGRYVGTYQFGAPILLLKTPEIIKQTCVKDFDHFLDHRNIIPEGVEELWSKNLFFLKGQVWKNMRSTLSPSFTSSKMKAMFVLICNNANAFVEHFEKKDDNVIEVEFKDLFTRYTNDVIANVGFGVQVDSLKDRENEFYMMGKDATNFNSAWKKFALFLYSVSPNLAGLFGVSFFGEKVNSFVMNLVKDTIKMREERNIKRPDMLGLLIEARKEQEMEKTVDEIKDNSFAVVEEHLEVKNIKRDLTDKDIASQVFVFILGGFESVSTAMCFTAYELALNPDIQNKLFEEIEEHKPQNGTPSYEVISNMTYLDMVISESLRKWPVTVATDRLVTKPYTIEPDLPGEEPVHLDVGTSIMVPISAIHHDPKYYENPEKFDPERFLPENRKMIDPYTYLPFGVGPRNCIGSRFALLEIKAVFFYLLSEFEIVPIEKTEIPLKLSNSFSITPKTGFPLGLKKRS